MLKYIRDVFSSLLIMDYLIFFFVKMKKEFNCNQTVGVRI